MKAVWLEMESLGEQGVRVGNGCDTCPGPCEATRASPFDLDILLSGRAGWFSKSAGVCASQRGRADVWEFGMRFGRRGDNPTRMPPRTPMPIPPFRSRWLVPESSYSGQRARRDTRARQ